MLSCRQSAGSDRNMLCQRLLTSSAGAALGAGREGRGGGGVQIRSGACQITTIAARAGSTARLFIASPFQPRTRSPTCPCPDAPALPPAGSLADHRSLPFRRPPLLQPPVFAAAGVAGWLRAGGLDVGCGESSAERAGNS